MTWDYIRPDAVPLCFCSSLGEMIRHLKRDGSRRRGGGNVVVHRALFAREETTITEVQNILEKLAKQYNFKSSVNDWYEGKVDVRFVTGTLLQQTLISLEEAGREVTTSSEDAKQGCKDWIKDLFSCSH